MSNKSTRGASRARRTKSNSQTALPSWIWLLTGLIIGFFVDFLMGLIPVSENDKTTDQQIILYHENNRDNENQPVFDFYTLLPESEVSVPMITHNSEREITTSNTKKTQVTKKSIDESHNTKYLLQAGSFMNVNDAERLRARLLLEGLTPKIEKVRVSGGETWHRVQIGPFSNKSELKNAQSILINHNIDSLLLQLKR